MTTRSTVPVRVFVAALLVAVLLIALASFATVGAIAAGPDLVDADSSPDDMVAGSDTTATIEIDLTDLDASGEETVVTIAFPPVYDGTDGSIAVDPGAITVDGVDDENVSVTQDGAAIDIELDPSIEGEDEIDTTMVVEVDVSHPDEPGTQGVDIIAEQDGDIEQTSVEFELLEPELSTTFGDEIVEDGGGDAETTLAVESARGDAYNVTVSATGLSGEELQSVFSEGELVDDETIVIEEFGDRDVSFAGIFPGLYEFEFEVLDTGTTDRAEVEVQKREMDAEFDQARYETTAGDFVEISVDLSGTDDGYVLFGDEDAGYLDILYLDGSSTVLVNTRLLGSDPEAIDTDAPAFYAEDGDVVSYAHEYGADTPPEETEEFEDVEFLDEDREPVAETLAEYRSAFGLGTLSRPLQPASYRLTASGDGRFYVHEGRALQADPDRGDGLPLDRSTLELTAPSLDAVNTYTAPPGGATLPDVDDADVSTLLDDAIEHDTLTKDERLVVEVEATGLYGALTAIENDHELLEGEGTGLQLLGTLDELPEGISMKIRQTNPGRNEERTTLPFDEAIASEASVFVEANDDVDEIDRFYVVVDTRNGGPFDGALDGGDEFEIEVAYESPEGDRYEYASGGATKPDTFGATIDPDGSTERYPYFDVDDETVSRTATFVVEDRELSFFNVHSDTVLVEATEEGSIGGETNLFPGTELDVQVVVDGENTSDVRTFRDVEIDDDGTFEITDDFSAHEPATELEIDVMLDDASFVVRDGTITEDLDEPVQFEIVDYTRGLTATQGDIVSNISATITNDGSLRDVQDIELSIDGTTVSETVRLDPGETATVTFEPIDTDELRTGGHEYRIETADDYEVGLLAIDEPPESEQTSDSEPGSENDTESADSTEDSVDDESDETDNESDEMDDETGETDDDAGDDETEQTGDDAGDDEAEGMDGESEEDTENEPDDEEVPEEDDENGLLDFGLGIAPRDVVGGSAIVGGIYLLGKIT